MTETPAGMGTLKAYHMSFLAADPDPHGSVSIWEARFGSASRLKAGSASKSKMSSSVGSKMEPPWRVVNAYNGGMEALIRAVEGMKTSGPRFSSL